MLKRWWLLILPLVWCISTNKTNTVSILWALANSPSNPIAETHKELIKEGINLPPGSKTTTAPTPAVQTVQKTFTSGSQAPPAPSGQAGRSPRAGDTRKTKNNAQNGSSGGKQQHSSQGGSEEHAAQVDWWDLVMLLLLALLALSSSAALIPGSFIGDWGRRACQAWRPLRKFMRLRNKTQIKLQMVALQYERVSQERARIAPRWFLARQMKDKNELANLKKQAYETEKILTSIRDRYVKELAESGFLRQLWRILSSRGGTEDSEESSDSSDSSVLSSSTVESLVEQRIQAEEANPCFEHDASPAESDELTGENATEKETSSFSIKNEEIGICSHLNGSEIRQRNSGLSDADSDDALPSQFCRGSKDGTRLSYKLNQLSQRKIGAMRRIVQQHAEHDKRLADALASSVMNPAGEHSQAVQTDEETP